ncbi:MAG: site-specific integrase [Planctomycetaceae bacterium]|nr:site-specific integrase [Planctomycetaceae bacterium]
MGGAVFDAPEIERLLAHVETSALHPWIHPLLATAAHTGARKGELLRIRVNDVDFAASHVVIREKKRVHDRRTTRRVPLSTALATILTEWLKPSRRPLPIRPSRACRAEQEAESDHRAFVEGSARRDEGAAR